MEEYEEIKAFSVAYTETGEPEIHLVYYVNVDLDVMATETDDLRITGVERESTLEFLPVSFTLDDAETWAMIKDSKPDSGATTTASSYQLHKHCRTRILDSVGRRIHVRTAGKRKFVIRKKGLVARKIGDQRNRLTEVLLIESLLWVTFLVEEGILQKEGLSINTRCKSKRQC